MHEDNTVPSHRPMLNAYPDSMGGRLSGIVDVLARPELKNVFESLYILPSVFNTDLDRGFSVIDYGLNELLATAEDMDAIRALGVDVKVDFVLNHLSVLSKQFQDIVKHGESSKYRDFFIDWNRFWDGCGEMTEAGYIQPRPELMKDMFFRKPGLPILKVRFPDGRDVPYWNTFYQEVVYRHPDAMDLMESLGIQYATAQELATLVGQALDAGVPVQEITFGEYERFRDGVVELLESRRRYMGQMDVNINSPLVWEYYDETLRTLAGYGAKIVRLDAFAYAPKSPGRTNFLNDPETWQLLAKVRELADKHGVTLLPEIHSAYETGTHERISSEGYMTYDFFLPGLILDALETRSGETLARWARELQDTELRTVNMLGCHDGIPLLDLKGLIPEERIDDLISTVVARGGYVKNLHGQRGLYYQVNATYFSAVGEDERTMLLARAIQLFMPGKPQVWYLDLLAGTNDHEAVELAGPNGHKEINRTNLTSGEVEARLEQSIVRAQLELLRFRSTSPAFGFDAKLEVEESSPGRLSYRWERDGSSALLEADLVSRSFTITDGDGKVVFSQ